MTGGNNTTFTSTGGISTSMTGGSMTSTGVPTVLSNTVRQYLKTDKFVHLLHWLRIICILPKVLNLR